MNMVGHKGKGVSGWLSLATAYALNLWADICAAENETKLECEFRSGAEEVNQGLADGLLEVGLAHSIFGSPQGLKGAGSQLLKEKPPVQYDLYGYSLNGEQDISH